MSEQVIMTKTVRLLDNRENAGDRHRFFSEGWSLTDHPEEIRTSVDISDADWRDLGEPEKITVTIEPGDRLNDA